MRITTLAGGVGGARFLRGLLAHFDRTPNLSDASVTVIGNTGDDINLFGLRVCPDLDTLMYTLGGAVHEEQGWGRANETHAVQGELAAYGAQPQWFGLGDLDFGTHIARSQWLGQGLSLSEVTARLCAPLGSARAWCTAAAHDGLPRPDPRRRRRRGTESSKGRSLPGVVGSHECGHPRPEVHRCWDGPRHTGTGRARRYPGGRHHPAAAEQPSRLHRHHPGGARSTRCVAWQRCSRRGCVTADRWRPGSRPCRRLPVGYRG